LSNTTPYSISIQPVYCNIPSNVSVGNITQNAATLSWNPNDATAWEYAVLPYGSDIPVSGQSATSNSVTITQATVGGFLMPGTHYQLYVRAACGNGQFSPWTSVYKFTTKQFPAPLDYQQDFELPLTGWTNLDGNQKNHWFSGTTGNATSKIMYISQDNGTTNTYDILSPSVSFIYRDIQIPAQVDQIAISFDWRAAGLQPDRLRLWIVPETFFPSPGNNINPGNGNVMVGDDFKGQASWTQFTTAIQASAYAGQTVRFVFEWYNDSAAGENPAAGVDNFQLSVVQCSSPPNLMITAASDTQVTYKWNTLTSATATYDYYFAQSPTAPTAGTTPTGNVATDTVTMTSLTQGTTNYFWVRSNCGGGSASAWSGPVSFVTPTAPQTLNYTEDFEGTHGWTLISGMQANKWVVGTALNNGGTKSLYISDDGGTTNHYAINPEAASFAYKDIVIPSNVGELFINFDWSCRGDDGDDISVWLVPVWYTPTPGIPLTAASGIGVTIALNLRGGLGWTHFSKYLNTVQFAGTSQRLLIQWRNNQNWGNQPPGAMDNVSITAITCAAPIAVAPATLSGNTLNLSWTGSPVISPTFDYYVSTDGNTPIASTPATGNIPGTSMTLATVPNTQYDVWVRSNCGGTEHSYWVGPIKYLTPQIPAVLDYQDDLENSTQWTLINDNENRWVLGDAVSSSPSKSIYISNNGGVDNVYSANDFSVSFAYRDIVVPVGTTEINFSFDWRNNGSTNHKFNVWVAPITYQPQKKTMIPDYLAFPKMQGTFYEHSDWTTANYGINATAYGGTTIRVIFEWISNPWGVVNNPPAAIDNINLSIATCPRPVALTAGTITGTSAILGWTEQGTASQWEVYVTEQGQAAPNTSTQGVIANAVNYQAAVESFKDYEFYVRALCGPDAKSGWAGPFYFHTPIANDHCATPTELPVNPGAACIEFKKAIFTNAGISPEANTCTDQNGGDIWYQFTATASAHNIGLSHFSGNAAPVLITLYEGDDCGNLIQLDCSSNNYLMAVNLVPGTTYRVRIVLNLNNAVQDTQLDVCVTTPTPPANNNAAQCTIYTVNADFEDPEHTGDPANPNFIRHNFVQGWRTTAPDSVIEFWADTNFLGFPAYSGHNFVELNANYASGLYQDYETPQITQFTYGFAHRGRLGEDTCVLKAGPPEGPFEIVTTKTTGTEQWDYVTGTYTTPANQPITRFIFESASAFEGDPTIGNFLDAISFTADNGILSVNPLALDCVENMTTVVGAGIGQWSAHTDNPSQTVIADADANTTTITGFATYGIYRYDWTTQYCTSVLEVNYGNLSIPLPAVADVQYCIGDIPVQLSVTPTGNNTLNWYTDETGGTKSAVAPTPNTTIAGVTTYYVSQSSAVGCEGSRAAITVTVNEIPAAPATQDVTYCQNETALPLTADAATGNTLLWYTEATGGTPLTAAPTPNTAIASVTDFYVSQNPISGCESSRAKLTVTVNPAILNVTEFTLPAVICTNAANPTAALATGFTAGGVFSTSSAELVIDPQTGTINLAASSSGTYDVTYALASDAAMCNPGGSTTVTINVVTNIDIVTGFDYDEVYCFGSSTATPTLAAGFTTGGLFASSTGLVIDPVTGTIDVNASTTGTYIVTYAIAANMALCNPGSSYNDTVIIGANLDFALIGDCKGSHFVISINGGLPEADGVNYEWKIGNGNPTGFGGEDFNVTDYINHTPEAEDFPLEIMLTVSSHGCEVSQTFVVDDIYCAIQRGISPNGDNKNDYFDLESMGDLKLVILNRYGKEVYTKSNYSKEWFGQDNHGNNLPTGTYFYMIELSGESKTGWIYINREE
jgi:gliding motility-associated-like protein